MSDITTVVGVPSRKKKLKRYHSTAVKIIDISFFSSGLRRRPFRGHTTRSPKNRATAVTGQPATAAESVPRRLGRTASQSGTGTSRGPRAVGGRSTAAVYAPLRRTAAGDSRRIILFYTRGIFILCIYYRVL